VAPASTNGLQDVDCIATTADCVAVLSSNAAGDPILGTTDGGVTWHSEPVPSGVFELGGIDCASAEACVAVGENGPDSVVTTDDGGADWTVGSLPSGQFSLADVACPSATECVAVGGSSANVGEALVSDDGGASWTQATVPAGLPWIAGVACGSTDECQAVGTGGQLAASLILGSTDGGQVWTSQTVPAGADWLTSVTCPSSTSCEGVGAGTSPDDGGLIVTDAPSTPALRITTKALPTGTRGQHYSKTLSATGGIPPYTWKLADGSKLPAGLTLGASTGAITGKPTAKSTSSTFTVVVHDTVSGTPPVGRTARATFTLTITGT
jgi:hypothetical protein